MKRELSDAIIEAIRAHDPNTLHIQETIRALSDAVVEVIATVPPDQIVENVNQMQTYFTEAMCAKMRQMRAN